MGSVTLRDSVDTNVVILTLQTAAPNRTEIEGNRGRAKSEQSETSNHFSLHSQLSSDPSAANVSFAN